MKNDILKNKMLILNSIEDAERAILILYTFNKKMHKELKIYALPYILYYWEGDIFQYYSVAASKEKLLKAFSSYEITLLEIKDLYEYDKRKTNR